MAYGLQTYAIVHDLSKGSDITRSMLSMTGQMDQLPNNLYAGDSLELILTVYENYTSNVKANFGSASTAKLYIKQKDTNQTPTELATGVITESVLNGGYDTITFTIEADKTTAFGGLDSLLYVQITDALSDFDYKQTISQEIRLLSLNGTNEANPNASEMAYSPSDESDWSTVPDDVSEALDSLADRATALEAQSSDNILTDIADTVIQYSLYYFDGTDFEIANATTDATGASKLLAIALDTDAEADGMLLSGFVTNASWSFTPGGALYMSTSAGQITQTMPTATDTVVRPIGYAISATKIYFAPDSHYIVNA